MLVSLLSLLEPTVQSLFLLRFLVCVGATGKYGTANTINCFTLHKLNYCLHMHKHRNVLTLISVLLNFFFSFLFEYNLLYMYVYTSLNVNELWSICVVWQEKAIRLNGTANDGYSNALELLVTGVPRLITPASASMRLLGSRALSLSSWHWLNCCCCQLL